jgi:hypothetical protein
VLINSDQEQGTTPTEKPDTSSNSSREEYREPRSPPRHSEETPPAPREENQLESQIGRNWLKVVAEEATQLALAEAAEAQVDSCSEALGEERASDKRSEDGAPSRSPRVDRTRVLDNNK